MILVQTTIFGTLPRQHVSVALKGAKTVLAALLVLFVNLDTQKHQLEYAMLVSKLDAPHAMPRTLTTVQHVITGII